jgi:hypothetical protein
MGALLAAKPHLRDRTAAMLAGELACPDLESEPMPETKINPVTLRLPAELLARVDALLPEARRLPELAMMTTITRADLLRLALVKGVGGIEAELAKKRPTLPRTEG